MRLAKFIQAVALSATAGAAGATADCGCTPAIQKRADRLMVHNQYLITEGFTPAPGRFRPQPFAANPQGIKITYLGAGGFLIERQHTAILTAPFFSNTSLHQVGLWRLDVQEALIDRYLPDLRNVEAILVGHAHYDHLLDIPYLWKNHARGATIFGNESVSNILAGADSNPPVKVLDSQVRSAAARGRFIPTHGGRIQFMAVRSSHAPNFRLPPLGRFGIPLTIAPWAVNQPLDKLPGRARGWRLGQTLAYVIDFRNPQDTSRVDFRIYYQDAAHIPEDWHQVPAASDSVDLAIVTVASTNFIGQKRYIEKIRTTIKPRHWLLGHWEDFFKDYSQNPECICSVPFTNPEGFVDELLGQGIRDEQWVLPTPGTVLHY